MLEYLLRSTCIEKIQQLSLLMQVHDWKLFLGVLSLVVVDVIILTVYTIVESIHEPDMSRLQAQRVINREYPEEESEVGVVASV